MATKKPAIHGAPPQGIPKPKGIDALPEANEAIKYMSEEHNRMASRRLIDRYAQGAADKARQYQQARIPELENVPDATGEKYRSRPVFQSDDGRYWLLIGVGGVPGSADGPIPHRVEAVTYVEVEIEGHRLTDILEWYEMTTDELTQMRELADKEEAARAESDAAQAAADKLIGKAPKHAITNSRPVQTTVPATLDEVERLIDQTGAKLTIIGTDTLKVEAASEAELVGMIGTDAPRHTAAKLRGHDSRVALLVHLLGQLRPLAVVWLRLGKRPASDVDAKQLANMVGPNGLFVH